MSELIIDSFAGGGGASLGIAWATGRAPDIAINHDAAAIVMHEANHPSTLHVLEDVWKADLKKLVGKRKVGLLWTSPSCTHFSRARGGTPVSKQMRSLGWIACRWAEQVKPKVIVLENVREFCFPIETAVLTKRGVIPIGEIKVGDKVWTHNSRWKPVTAISRSVKDTIRVKGYGNTIIEPTPDHRFYARECGVKMLGNSKHEWRLLEPTWIPAERLADIDKTSTYTEKHSGFAWATPTEMPTSWLRLPDSIGIDCKSESFFWTLGAWCGNGWVKKRRDRINQDLIRIWSPPEKAERTLHQLKKTGLKWSKTIREEGPLLFDLEVASSRKLIKWITKHFGNKSKEKRIPAWLFSAPEHLRRAFIDGYCHTDGHVHLDNECHVVSTSRCLAVGLKLLLQSIGFSATVGKVKRDSKDVANHCVESMNSTRFYSVSWRKVVCWEKCKRTESHIWGRVRSVAEGRKQVEVVDITVADDHSFVADGQVVHNCDWGPVIPKYCCRDCDWSGTEGQAVLARVRRKCPRCSSVRLRQTEEYVPDPEKKGITFRRFVGRLKNLGYKVEWRNLDAADYGAPTHRKRLFLIARCDGEPIVWPEPTHAAPHKINDMPLFGQLKPYRTAAECIDWSIPCPSIFERKRPLAEKTMRRIAHGIKRYVLDAESPFIVQVGYGERSGQTPRTMPVDEPIGTLVSTQKHAIVTPILSKYHGQKTESDSRCKELQEPFATLDTQPRFALVAPTLTRQFGKSDSSDIAQPLPTIVAGGGGKTALVAAFVAKHFGGMVGVEATTPLPTTTSKGCQSQLVTANLIHMNHGEKQWSSVEDPLRTVTSNNHAALVYAFLVKFFGTSNSANLHEPMPTATTKDRFGFVTVEIDNETYVITDIGMRMLTPRELARAQGFPETYVLTGTKTSQVARIGNSVCPAIAKAIVEANYANVLSGAK